MESKDLSLAYKYVRILIALVPIVALGFFAYQYANPSGQLVVAYDFCQKETPYFSGLSPYGRVLDIQSSPEACAQSMVIDPVYFDIRLPQSYRTAIVEVDYLSQSGEQAIDIGVGRDPEAWDWVFNKEAHVSKQPWTYTTTLSLSEAQFKNNRYRFIVSAPGIDVSGDEITFYRMKFVFEKEPITKDNIWERLQHVFE